MLEVIDTGVAYITKREKAFQYYGVTVDSASPNDQDAYLLDCDYDSYAVADGVGSSRNAAIAARDACLAYLAAVKERHGKKDLTERELATYTLDRVHAAALGSLGLTTFTGMLVHNNHGDTSASYLHLGDSQLVLLRDDTVHHLTSEQVHENGYSLYNYLGTPDDWASVNQGVRSVQLTSRPNTFDRVYAEWGSLYLQDGDRFALMTDGIVGSSAYDRLSDETLRHFLNRRFGAVACAQQLLSESRKVDDSTIVVVDIGFRT